MQDASGRGVRCARTFGLALVVVVTSVTSAGADESRRQVEWTLAAIGGVLAGDRSTTYLAGAGARVTAEARGVSLLAPIISAIGVVYPATGARFSAAHLTAGARYRLGATGVHVQADAGIGATRDQLRLRLLDRTVDEATATLAATASAALGWVPFWQVELGACYLHVVPVGSDAPWVGHVLASVGYRL